MNYKSILMLLVLLPAISVSNTTYVPVDIAVNQISSDINNINQRITKLETLQKQYETLSNNINAYTRETNSIYTEFRNAMWSTFNQFILISTALLFLGISLSIALPVISINAAINYHYEWKLKPLLISLIKPELLSLQNANLPAIDLNQIEPVPADKLPPPLKQPKPNLLTKALSILKLKKGDTK